jgi:hypothetical protein
MLSPGSAAGGAAGRWRAFRRWRRTRPFWGGLLTLAGGYFLVAPPLAPLGVMIRAGGAATSGLMIGAILVIGGAFHWFAPRQRTFVALVCAVCSVISFVAANLGGVGLGMLLGLVGSAMAFGWVPGEGTATTPAGGAPGGASAGAHAGLVAVALLFPGGAGPAPVAAPPTPPPGVTLGTFVPRISATRLEGRDVRVLGSTRLSTAGRSVEVLRLHFGTAVLRDYRLATGEGDRPFSLAFDVTVHDVDIYATDLRGRLAVGDLSVPVTLTPGLIPPGLPVDVTLPSLTVDDVRAGQALITSPRATFDGLSITTRR